MSGSFLQTSTVLRGRDAALRSTVVNNGHSAMTSLPTELLLKIVLHLTMAQFLRFRGVCRYFLRITNSFEGFIVRQLLKRPELRQASDIFGNTGPEMEKYNHLFRLKRRCSIVNTLVKFILKRTLKEYGEGEQFVGIKVRSHLLWLAHYLESHRFNLVAFVSELNYEPYLGVPNEEIEFLTLAKYDHEAAYFLCGFHDWLMGLLEKRLQGKASTVLETVDAPRAQYAKLLVLGGIEAIRDSIVPRTFTERYSKMEMHMQRACSVSRANDSRHTLPEVPEKAVDLALVLDPITPPLDHQTAINVCGILPREHDLLEELVVRLPRDPSGLWQVDMNEAEQDYILEVSPDNPSVVGELFPPDDDDTQGWLATMAECGFMTLTRVE